MSETIVKSLEGIFRDAFNQAGVDENFPVMLRNSPRADFGDYQINGIMAAAKKLGCNSNDLAQRVVSYVERGSIIEKLEVAGQGFINITLYNRYLEELLAKNSLLKFQPDQAKVVVVDYSSPNLVKEMHVGHLRSTIIGDALVRMHEFLGNRVIRRNHVGDWGTQFGMLLAYLAEIQKTNQEISLELKDLEEFYRKSKYRFDNDQEFAKQSRDFVVKLQAEDPEIIKIWKKFVEISLEHCQEIYARLGVKLMPEDAVGESFYNDLLPVMVSNLLKQKVATDNDGAKCVFFNEGEIDVKESAPFIIQKQDGGYLYSTADIAAVYDRINNLKADILLYVIDSRQSLHLKQLFATVKKAKIVSETTHLEHVAFGTMLGTDNKPFKTRSGDTVKLTSLIDEAVSRAKEVVSRRNRDWDQASIDKLAEVLGVASVKYADLSKNRICDYVFNLDQMLSFEGNTAPYLLYAYVRINSIFRKLGLSMGDYLEGRRVVINSVEERTLAIHLVRFIDTVMLATKESYPHYICNYIYELAVIFMRFYENCPIIKASQEIKDSRLTLIATTSAVLKNALDLLGIVITESM